MTYTYRIKDTGYSSARLGDCELCGTPVAQVHYQVEASIYVDESGRQAQTYHECRNLFGHQACLLSARR